MLVFWVLSWLILGSAQAESRSLEEAFFASIHENETLGVAHEGVVQAHESHRQALGAMLPKISFNASFLEQQTPQSPTGATISPGSQQSGVFNLSQPLFQGTKEYAAMRQTMRVIAQQTFQWDQSLRSLFLAVAESYYQVLGVSLDFKNIETQILHARQRLSELQAFYKIGRVQKTDVLTMQANIASLLQLKESIRGQREVAWENLRFLTHWEGEFDLTELQEGVFSEKPIEAFLETFSERSDLKVAQEAIEVARESQAIAFGGHLPTATLNANAYPYRPGALSTVHWDASLVLSFPIFQGGIVQSQVRQADSVLRAAELQFSLLRRGVEKEVRSTYSQWISGLKQFRALKELVKTAEKLLETEKKLFRNSLVTNLDVLSAMSTYEDAHRQLDRQRVACQWNLTQLLVASGQQQLVKKALLKDHKP